MHRLRSIAVGIDFSPRCELALRQAIRIARWSQAELHLIHVLDRDAVEDLEPAASEGRQALIDDLVQSSSDRLMALLEQAPELKGKVHVRLARPAAGIIDCCDEIQVDLLVLGIRGHSSTDRRAGTQSLRIARSAPVTTLLVHERAEGRFQKLTVCTDFSSYAEAALGQAARIAEQDASHLELLHVYTPPWQVMHYRMPTIGADPDFQQQYRAGLSGRLEGSIQRHAAGQPVTPVLVEHFNHADGILEHSHLVGSDLIVIGHRGRSGLIERFLLGSTADRVLGEADCSVLLVRAE